MSKALDRRKAYLKRCVHTGPDGLSYCKDPDEPMSTLRIVLLIVLALLLLAMTVGTLLVMRGMP